MTKTAQALLSRWTSAVPLAALALLIAVWGRDLPGALVVIVSVFLGGAVLSAVHHAEVIAHRVGEPFGSLVLAVAVTVIEVALIVTLVTGGSKGSETLARDTVFAAIMITTNGVVGLSLLAATLKRGRVAVFNAEGTGGALAAVGALATLCLVVPTFTEGRSGPEFTGGQLTFAAVFALGLYALFVGVQTVRHRDYFLPTEKHPDVDHDDHADPPSDRTALISLALLLAALVAVVGNAKTVSPAIESGVSSAGMPQAVVGIVIAVLILLPETIAAVRAARLRRVQISLNLAYGSAMASIGLTIPVIAIAQIWIDGPLVLGLGDTEIVLLLLTLVTSVLTVVPGRATVLQGGIHVALLAAFLFLAASP
jgi:Ca2+:H+ antiporter